MSGDLKVVWYFTLTVFILLMRFHYSIFLFFYKFPPPGEEELSGSEGSEMAAELEEKEAIALQQRMTAALSEADFLAPTIPVKNFFILKTLTV